MRVLGLINARGGSKGIPDKNIRPLHGVPLIAYTIRAGLEARRIHRLVVSTDDPRIMEVARSFGAETPFRRPADLATDASPQVDAVRHALMTLIAAGDQFDVVALLQPTCPLRTDADIDEALALLERTGADTVISVTKAGIQHPLHMYSKADDGTLHPLFETDSGGVPRQQLPAVWWRNGAVYATRVAVVLERGSLYGDRIVGYAMPPERSLNIDEPFDWLMTEVLLTRSSLRSEPQTAER